MCFRLRVLNKKGIKTMNEIEKFEQRQKKALTEKAKTIPEFSAGDTLRVNVKITEKTAKETKTRIQAYEGVCIARNGKGINESFTVRKISYGEGVERVFPLYAPIIDSIELIRRGSVRRAKLYYLRERSGKAARIKEHVDNKKPKSTKKSKNTEAKKAAVA